MGIEPWGNIGSPVNKNIARSLQSFARNSQRIAVDGSTLAVNAPSVNKGGTEVWESTTNLIPDGKQKFEGWTTPSGITSTITQGQAITGYTDSAATRIQAGGGTNTLKYICYLTTLPIQQFAANTPYTLSLIVQNVGSSTAKVQLSTVISATIQPGETSKVVLPLLSGSVVAAWLAFAVVNASDVVDIVAYQPQVEQKSYATPYQDPALGARADEALTVSTYVNATASELAACAYGVNLLSANQASGGELGTIGGFLPNVATITSDTTQYKQGTRSIKVECPGGTANEGVSLALTTAVQGAYSARFWVYGASGSTDGWIRYKYSDNSYTDTTHVTATLAGVWQEVLIPASTTNTGKTLAAVEMHMRTGSAQAITYWVDQLCLERVPDATAQPFTSEYPNLIPLAKQHFESFGTYGAESTVITQGQALPGYTANEATRLQSYGGNDAIKFYYTIVGFSTPGKVAYTASMVVSVPEGAPTVRVSMLDNSNNSRVDIAPGETKLVTLTRSPNAGSGLALAFSGLNVSDNLDFYVYQLMLVKQEVAGSWIPGQTKRVIDSTQGTILLCTEVTTALKRINSGNQPYLFFAKGAGSGSLILAHANSVASFGFYTYADDGTNTTASTGDANVPNGRRVIGIRWSASEASMWIDGVKRITIATPKLSSALSSANLLCGANGAFAAGTTLYWAQLENVAQSDEWMARKTADPNKLPMPTATTTHLETYANDGTYASPYRGTKFAYEMDGNTKTLRDKRIGAPTATITGATRVPAVSIKGKCLSFDGVDDIATLAADYVGTGSITFECACYFTGWGGGSAGRLISTGYFGVYPDGNTGIIKVTSNNNTTTASGAVALQLNTWYIIHVVRTASGTATIYINGKIDTAGVSGTPVLGANTYIGNNGTGLKGFAGYMRYVSVIASPLSSTEVASRAQKIANATGIKL